jgi:hypothetical protein
MNAMPGIDWYRFARPMALDTMPEMVNSSGGLRAMRIQHYADGKFYLIECPEVSRAEPERERIVVRFAGKDIKIPSDPPGLLSLFAEAGRFGLSLIGEPEPEIRLAGAVCPACGEKEVDWFQLNAAGDSIHCDNCHRNFEPMPLSVGGRATAL